MKKILIGCVVCFAVLAFSATACLAAGQYKDEYKLSVVVGPKGAWGEGAQKFADLVKEKSGGKINIKCYFGGQLFAGKQTNEFLLLRQGVADFALASTINWSPQVIEMNLFALPFFFDDYKQVDAVKNGAPGQKLMKLCDEKGVMVLSWGENGFRELTNSKKPVKTPEDLAGLKIRVVGSPLFIDIFRALGANPINMNWGEAQTAFQQGTVDGQENPVNTVLIPVQIWQTQKFFTIWHYTIDPLMYSVSKEVWNTFSKEDQALLSQCAKDAAVWQVAEARKGLEGDMPGLKVIRDNGAEVTILTADQRKAFRAKTRAVHEEWTKKIGAELVAEAEKLIGKK